MDAGLALLGTVGVCVLGSFLPWVNTEAAVVTAALLLPPRMLPLLVLGAASAQVFGKGTLYALARWAPRRLPVRARTRIAGLSALAARRTSLGLAVLASSTVGVPPFYVMALACGTVSLPLAFFLSAAFAGAVVRYAVISLAAVLLKG